MTVSVDHAAAELLHQIDAPHGAVNTLAGEVRSKKVIRVLVDPTYWYRLKPLPKRFKGYAVQVEKRGAIEFGHASQLRV